MSEGLPGGPRSSELRASGALHNEGVVSPMLAACALWCAAVVSEDQLG
jgi:hypothetical protein